MKLFIRNYRCKVVFTMLTAIFSSSLLAQVTIGSLEKPEKYVTLKVDNEDEMKGLRLNRLSNTERNNLPIQTAQDKEKAKGLLIYNETAKRLEYFDGEKWSTFPNPYYSPVLSGLSIKNNIVSLGGKLSDEAVITQGEHPLNFKIGAGETGTFTIDHNDTPLFSADNAGASSKNVDKFDLNKGSDGGRVDIANGNINMNTGAKGLDVNNSALSISGNSIHIKGNLTYADGTQQADHILLAENAEGQAKWVELTPTILHKTFHILPAVGEITKKSQADNATTGKLPGPSSSEFLTISEAVTLEPGKWLITGTFFAYTDANTSDDGGRTASAGTTGKGTGAGVIKISRTDIQPHEDVYITGVIPEVKKGDTEVYLSASVAAYVDVVGTSQTFVIKARGHSEPFGSSPNNGKDRYTYLLKGGTGSDFIAFDPKGRGNAMKAMRIEEYK